MNVLRKADRRRHRVAAIGMWDGVHRGHRFLIDYLLLEAGNRTLTPAVVTFAEHPKRLVNPEKAPRLLSTLEDRLGLLEDAGVEDVILLTFNNTLRRSTARRFLDRLHKSYGIDVLVVGFNNRFGHNRVDGINEYRRIGDEIGLEVIEAPEFKGSDMHVSSSAIRDQLAAGHVEKAAEMLGRPYMMRGVVVEGNRLGRTLGFPTANLRPSVEEAVLPGGGVYAGYVSTPDGERRPAVINIGYRPTVKAENQTKQDSERDDRLSIEVHIPNFTGYLYDDEITVEFVARLRDEKRFKSLDKLKDAIAADVKRLEKIVAGK